MEIPQSKVAAVIAGVVILVAGGVLWQTFRSSSTTVNLAPVIGVAEVLAEETVKAVHNRGRVVAVISPEHQQSDSPLREQWEIFRRELKQHSGITLAATETVAFDPSDPQPDMMSCPIAAFKSILERHGQADAIVFFVGVPAWRSLQERNSLPPSANAKLIVLGSTTAGPKLYYQPYFANELIAALVLRWGSAATQVANPKTPREWFNNEYQIFTPQNYESLPE